MLELLKRVTPWVTRELYPFHVVDIKQRVGRLFRVADVEKARQLPPRNRGDSDRLPLCGRPRSPSHGMIGPSIATIRRGGNGTRLLLDFR